MVLFRPGRAAPSPGMKLPWRWVRPGDGWSDGAEDPEYNRPVRHPHGYSAEHLEREDGLNWVKNKLPTVKAFKTFQVLPEEFLQTLELCYGIDRAAVMQKKADQVDLNLSLYLQLEKRKAAH